MKSKIHRMLTERALKALWAAIVGSLVVLTPITSASAHPHVWVAMQTEILYGKSGKVTGFRHKWTFDEFYSSFATQGLDKNKDGVFDKEELTAPANALDVYLKEFDYFNFAKQGAEALADLDPDDYWLEFKDSLLTMHFTIRLQDPADAAVEPVVLSVYDPTFYVSLEHAEKNPLIKASNSNGCTATLNDPGDKEMQVAESLSQAFSTDAQDAPSFISQFTQDIVISCNK